MSTSFTHKNKGVFTSNPSCASCLTVFCAIIEFFGAQESAKDLIVNILDSVHAAALQQVCCDMFFFFFGFFFADFNIGPSTNRILLE